MNKRDALKKALTIRKPKLPKLSESTKLWVSGIVIGLAVSYLSILLYRWTKNPLFTPLLIGLSIFIVIWFMRASLMLETKR